MTIRHLVRRLRPVLLITVLVAAALTLWHPGPSLGFDATDEKTASLGVVGMSAGQTLRISVADAVGFDPQPDFPGRCALKIAFVDTDGAAVGDPTSFELSSGTARSFDLSAELAGVGAANIRAYVRPVVIDLRPHAGCRAVVTTEVLDREGTRAINIHMTPVQPPIPIL